MRNGIVMLPNGQAINMNYFVKSYVDGDGDLIITLSIKTEEGNRYMISTINM